MLSITNNYRSGLYCARIDEDTNKFEKGEELLVYYKLIDLITDKEWRILILNNSKINQIPKFIPIEKKKKLFIQIRRRNLKNTGKIINLFSIYLISNLKIV